MRMSPKFSNCSVLCHIFFHVFFKGKQQSYSPPQQDCQCYCVRQVNLAMLQKREHISQESLQ